MFKKILCAMAVLVLAAPAAAQNVGWGRNVDGTSPNGLVNSCSHGDTLCHYSKGTAGALDTVIGNASMCEEVTYETAAASTLIGDIESCPLGTAASCFVVASIPDGAALPTTSKHAFLRLSVASGVGTVSRTCAKAAADPIQVVPFYSNGNPVGTECWQSTVSSLTPCADAAVGASHRQTHVFEKDAELVSWSCYFEVVAGGVGVGDFVVLGPAWYDWDPSAAHADLGCSDTVDLDTAAPFVHTFTCPAPVPVGPSSATSQDGLTNVKFRGIFTEPNDVTALESACALYYR